MGPTSSTWTRVSGTVSLDVGAAYGEARNRAELRSGGVTVVVGAAGPMGQMHVERALSLPDGPRLVVAVDLDAGRLRAAGDKLAPVATAYGRELIVELLGPEPDALAVFGRPITHVRGPHHAPGTAPSATADV